MKLLSMLLGQSYYVLDDISINEVGPDYVFIKTRKGGFFAWLWGLFGFKTTQEFHLFPDRIETEVLGGSKKKNVLSLSSVSLIDCEYVVPSSFLIMAVLFLIPIVTIPLSVICLLLYFRNKKILITATANSGDKISIFFKGHQRKGLSTVFFTQCSTGKHLQHLQFHPVQRRVKRRKVPDSIKHIFPALPRKPQDHMHHYNETFLFQAQVSILKYREIISAVKRAGSFIMRGLQAQLNPYRLYGL